ncbi:MAG TPA: RNA polymerase sigma factor [Bauldia sp.]|nr:RNA polymerase sigma factor [Bauldia sp.]
MNQAGIEAVYRAESRRVLATLIRLLRDFDLAEEAMHEAFAAAAVQWPRGGTPKNPRAWLVSAGRFKGIDRLRRRARFEAIEPELAMQIEADAEAVSEVDDDSIPDDRLRLIFTCCHPTLAPDAQVALTLREVCGLTTEEIARAFLVPTPTVAQRIVRAKAKIREARIPYMVPPPRELPERLDAVLRVIYLVFNEGYSATSGDSVTRGELSAEAIRLGRLVVALLPEPEAMGLLALMLLHESRRATRMSPDGEIVLLPDQDRSLWDRGQIAEGCALVATARAANRPGPYVLQAAIAAAHASARSPEETDWMAVARLYAELLQVEPSPIVALNHAAAVSIQAGPNAGLELVDRIVESGDIPDYYLLHSARADMLRRLGRFPEAESAYARAFELARQEPERRFLARRLAEIRGILGGPT